MTKKFPENDKSFLEGVPLYGDFEITSADTKKVISLMLFKGSYDSFCTDCQRESTFQVNQSAKQNDFIDALTAVTALMSKEDVKPSLLTKGAHVIKGECARAADHKQFHIFNVGTRKKRDIAGREAEIYFIQKIGQYPSAADLGLSKIKRYGAVLSKQQMLEFSKAIGLASHGVGVGAYVYLRRIFEALIESAHEDAVGDKKWNEKKYVQARMGERIRMLKNHLPEFIAENPQMYSLLSKGVHEMSEQECSDHFNTLRICIELVLDQKIERVEKAKKVQAARSELSKAVNAVGSSKA